MQSDKIYAIVFGILSVMVIATSIWYMCKNMVFDVVAVGFSIFTPILAIHFLNCFLNRVIITNIKTEN